MSTKAVDFLGLRDAFCNSLGAAFEKNDVLILLATYESFNTNTDQDKKSPMDQAFREMLLFKLNNEVERIGILLRLSVEAVRMEIVTVTIPVVLLADIFDAVTLNKCERIFTFVEDMVDVWKEEIFFSSCKNNILRMCNDLLRRLSRAQNTVFCGRILLFLSKFFPFSERSGLNIVSEFNLDNVTEYGIDGKDLDDTLEDTVEDMPIKIDYNLYCKFWSLQDFFRNPNQCYSKAQWKMFQAHAGTVLEAFASFKLEETRLSSTTTTEDDEDEPMKMVVDTVNCKVKSDTDAEEKEINGTIQRSENFFAKFLTNPKLLALQLSDTNFRRSVLVQFLILFQYLQLTVKFKNESNTLTTAQTEFIKETETKVYRLLEETPPNGKRFTRTVQHMLTREEMWNNWKNDGCKEFKKPDDDPSNTTSAEDSAKEDGAKAPSAKKLKRPLGDSLRDASRNGKFFLGNEALTRLWNHSPDNLLACKSEQRNFQPQVDAFLENPHERSDPSFEWRALRLLARQSPHFFMFPNASSYKICDYLDNVRRRLLRDKLESAKWTQSVRNSNNNSTTESCPNNISSAGATTKSNVADTLVSDAGGSENNEETLTEHYTEQIDNVEDDTADLEKVTADIGEDDAHSTSKPLTATREQIEEIVPLIGDTWMKLGKKLGFKADELLYFETEHPKRDGGCIAMLNNWFAEDDDATLDNFAYILEGLEIHTAAKAVKALIDRLTAREQPDIEMLSD